MKTPAYIIRKNIFVAVLCSLVSASVLSILFQPVTIYAADIEFEKSVEYKIIEDCSKTNDPQCIYKHWGGNTNMIQAGNECQYKKEPQRCRNSKLLALEINAKYRPKQNTNPESEQEDQSNPIENSYPNTKCFTALGGVLQEKLCPKDATYPNGNPPETNKCYGSQVTEDNNRPLYEEVDCDKSKFSVGAYGEEKKEDESNPSECQQRMKLSAGWIVCSGLELLSSGMDTLFGYIDSLLNVNVIKLNASDDQGLYKSWSYFRGIATFMLFAVGLVMIIGQAVGGGKN